MSFLRPAEVKYLMMGQVIPVRWEEFSSAEKGWEKVVLQGTWPERVCEEDSINKKWTVDIILNWIVISLVI